MHRKVVLAKNNVRDERYGSMFATIQFASLCNQATFAKLCNLGMN